MFKMKFGGQTVFKAKDKQIPKIKLEGTFLRCIPERQSRTVTWQLKPREFPPNFRLVLKEIYAAFVRIFQAGRADYPS